MQPQKSKQYLKRKIMLKKVAGTAGANSVGEFDERNVACFKKRYSIGSSMDNDPQNNDRS